MRRRELLAALGGAAAALPRRALGQQARRQFRIAFAAGALPAGEWREMSIWRAALAELHRLGYVEGVNLGIETFSADGRIGRYADIAYAVEDSNPNLIVAVGNGDLVINFRTITTTPVVAVMGFPFDAGILSSLARPGGNLTGVTLIPGIDFWGKQLQLLKEAVPAAARIGLLATHSSRNFFGQQPKGLGAALVPVPLDDATPPAIANGFAELARQRLDAVLIHGEPELLSRGRQITALSAGARLPALYPYRDYVLAGGLMAYGPDLSEVGRAIANAVSHILGGARPGDIPIYQSTKFELVINLKTAKALGLTVPQSILARADEVIE